MFIDGRHLFVTKAPEGRHVYRTWVSHIHPRPKGATCHKTTIHPDFWKSVRFLGVTQLALTCKGVELDMHAPPV